MSQPRPAEVESVAPSSPAARAGIAAGDRVVRVNGGVPRDYIDYRYLAAEPRVSLLVEDEQGARRRVAITKTVDGDLGLRFVEDVFDGVMTCGNRCPFCFVAQLPGGLRPALYVRDDDYRLSFLHGNFITLTNLTPADRARIARLHLSPLYVSVHATEPEVRERMFGRPSVDVLAGMRRLCGKGIEFHAQIVVCPGINDGAHLERTVRDLAALYPGVGSIGVVPVGLTKHRRQGVSVRPVTARMARGLIEVVHCWQKEFSGELGRRLVFAADEMYLATGIPLPGRAQYEGFPQLANGIGCARQFLDEVRRIRPPKLRRRASVTLVTGEMAAGLVEELAVKLNAGDVRAEVCVVANGLLGRSVTTAGLLAGRDVARALRRRKVADLMIMAGTAVREGEVFIDGMTLEDLSEQAGAPVVAAATPAEATASVRRFDRGRAVR